ncbi:hypothetical protein AB0D45_01555 [Streptomyces sp. NPDC048352]|uniref:hypothetical protein n=1 Tax=Streptomyces sp. NPDC048352 TaxID=3154718 RepID=UPI00341CC196
MERAPPEGGRDVEHAPPEGGRDLCAADRGLIRDGPDTDPQTGTQGSLQHLP